MTPKYNNIPSKMSYVGFVLFYVDVALFYEWASVMGWGALVMRITNTIITISLATAVTACANHPLQDDVTGYSNDQIIHKVRCEAQNAIVDYLHSKNLVTIQDKIFLLLEKIEYNEEHLKNLLPVTKQIKKWEADETLLDNKNSLVDNIALKNEYVSEKKELEKAIDLSDDEIAQLETLIKITQDKDIKKRLMKSKNILLAGGLEILARINALESKIKELNLIIINIENDINNLSMYKFGIGYNEYLKIVETPKKLKNIITNIYAGSIISRKLQKFNELSLSLQFDFSATESDNAVAQGTLQWPVPLGNIKLILDAGKTLERKGQRVMKISDSFLELSDENSLKCWGSEIGPHLDRAKIFPITGNIGIRGFIEQYLAVSDASNIATSAGKTSLDTLTFTTTVNAGALPSVSLAPLSPNIVNAHLDLDIKRIDLHEVVAHIFPRASPMPPDKKAAKK